MGYGANKDRLHRIQLADYDGSENWVDIKEARSPADKAAVQKAGQPNSVARTVSVTGAHDVTLDLDAFDYTASRVVLFKRMIVGWSLRANDDDDQPMPLHEDTFRNGIDDDISEWLAGKIHEHYEQRRPSPERFLNLNGSSTLA